MDKFFRFLIDLPRWGLLLAIIYAPWMFGSVTLWAQRPLIKACLILAAAHAVISLVRRSFWLPPWWLIALAALLLMQGWFMTWNAAYTFSFAMHKIVRLIQHEPGWPGSFNQKASESWMWRISALFAAMWMVADISRNQVWRQRILWTLAGSGALLVGFGLWQKLAGSSGLWPQYGKNIWPFATFYYHGNAGAFINLVIPLTFVLALHAFMRERRIWAQAVWCSAFVVCLAGAVVNASKGAIVVTGTVLILLIYPFWRFMSKRSRMAREYGKIGWAVAFLALTVAFIVWAAGPEKSKERWIHAFQVGEQIYSGRLAVAQICLKMAPEAGWWGFGPNTFATIFDQARRTYKEAPDGFWQYAHEDYLQTVLEWGWAGALLWGCLLLGGTGFIFLKSMGWGKEKLSYSDRLMLFGAGTALSGIVLHAGFDFPLQIMSLQLYTLTILAVGVSCPNWETRQRTKINWSANPPEASHDSNQPGNS